MNGLQVPSFLEGHVSQLIGCMQNNVENDGLWAVRLKLIPYQDGDRWCVLYGENIQVGIFGWGSSPYLAMCNFEDEWYKKETP